MDVSNWLRPDAATSPERMFCLVYGRGKGNAQMIPGWCSHAITKIIYLGRSPANLNSPSGRKTSTTS